LVLQSGIAEALRARGVVVSLFASAETIIERTGRNNNRPLLNVENREARIRELLAAREPAYLAAGAGIYTDGRSLPDVIERITRIYRKQDTEDSGPPGAYPSK
jgi:shikimate kinase